MPSDRLPLIRGIAQVGPALVAAARRFGTPTYVMDMASVGSAAGQVEAAFATPWVLQYSLKANDLPAISSFLHGRGWGGNVVSTGEWQFARHGGIGNAAVTFEGIGKTDAQLEFAVLEAASGRPPRWLAIESANEADRLAMLADRHNLGRSGTPALDVLVRINPQVTPETRAEFAVGRASSKFGMTGDEILALIRTGVLNGAGIRLRGIHVHAGSDLRDVVAWANAGVRAMAVLHDAARLAPWADTVDFGGGFPLPGDGTPGPLQFRDALLAALDRAGLALPARPAIEPGRYLVGGAGWLVSSVLHARTGHGSGQAMTVLDAGMTEFMRPALYGSRHRLHALPLDRWQAESLRETSVEGPVCESTDSFGMHLLPPLARGDLVAIETAGAYAASFTSRYNGRPAPTEVLLWPDGTLERCHRPELVSFAPTAHPAYALAGLAPSLGQPTPITTLHCG